MQKKRLKCFLIFGIVLIVCFLPILFVFMASEKIDKDVTYLDISIKTSNLTIKKGKSFYVDCKNKKTDFKINDNKAIIKENSKDSIVITIPDSVKLNQVYIDLGEGELELDYLKTDFFDLLGGSKANINNLIVNNKTDINGCNSVDINNSIINNLDLFVLDSKININGEFKGQTEISGGTGILNINLKDNDYNYTLSNIEGTLTIDNHQVTKDGKYYSGNKKIAIKDCYGKIKISMKE